MDHPGLELHITVSFDQGDMLTRNAPSSVAERRAARDVLSLTAVTGTAFAAFYGFYSAAPMIFADATPSAGVRIAVFMAVVVAVQPFVLAVGRLTRSRALVAGGAMVAMAAGLAVLPVADSWPGLVLLGAGFGVFVVTSTAWAKELAAPGRVGQALGTYGFGSALGGAVGAPVGLALASQAGLAGVVIGGAVLALVGVALVGAVARKLASRDSTAQAETGGPVVPLPDTAPDTGPGAVPTVEAAHTLGETPRAVERPGRRMPDMAVVPLSLAGHFVAVTLYAAVLLSAGTVAEESTAIAAVLVAFAIQSSVALGRLIAGTLADLWSAAGTGLVAAALLTVAVMTFANATATVIVVASSAVVGLAAGAIQTVALTLMMRRARTPARTEQVSAAWNIAFDAALGAGGLAAGFLVLT